MMSFIKFSTLLVNECRFSLEMYSLSLRTLMVLNTPKILNTGTKLVIGPIPRIERTSVKNL